jgi:serine/threonine protein kinase
MKIAGRYEVTAKVGQGGMGVVYRAYDPAPMDREVAVKTLHEFADPLALDLFYRECRALKSISHPNIVEIFDMGEFEEGGHKRPFFVMPLLPGQTLDALIKTASHRLTVDRVVEIISQTCRGLQAAHERGLVHRDLKPSNIFVMADDSVKLIDFGVAHAVTARSRTTGFDKGTLLYMAPEQIQHKPVSAQSDIYALGLTMYEALTRRQPFRLGSEAEVIDAILNQSPPPASSLNPAVSPLMTRAVHKAIAKQPWNRYETPREFADTIQKALRNEPIAIFDPARVQPRIQTALKALEDGDEQFAAEIVGELESEGTADSQLALLRAHIDQAVRHKTLTTLLQSARSRYEQGEEPLALQKINEALQIDPDNATALELKVKIEERRSEREFEKWIALARQHAENRAYANAHDALQKAIALRPDDSRVSRVQGEIDEGETGTRISSLSETVAPPLPATVIRPVPAAPTTPAPPPGEGAPSPVERAHAPVAPAPPPVEKRREGASAVRIVALVGGIAAIAVVAVIGVVWMLRVEQTKSAVEQTPVQGPAAATSVPPAVTPAPVIPVPVPPVAPAPAAIAPPVESQPAPAPRPAPARGPSPQAAPAAVTTSQPQSPGPTTQTTSPPPSQTPAVAPAPTTTPSQTTTSQTTPSQTRVVDPLLPPALRGARAAELLNQALQSERAEDWPAALGFYERARLTDPSMAALALAGVERVRAQMLADGSNAFKRAQEFDASNRVNDAITWYERAVRNLPEDSAERRIAAERLRTLKSGR